MQEMQRELRLALRVLARKPGFALIVILTTALGIGANTAVFSVVHSVLLRPLPFPHPERLLALTEYYPQLKQSLVVSPVFLDWQDRATSLETVAAYGIGDYTLTSGDQAERLSVATVSESFFHTLGVAPRLGRAFSPEEDRPGADRVVVLSTELWNRKFGADPSAIGRSLLLDGQPYRIVGIAPQRLQFPRQVQLWVPFALDPVRERQGGMINLVRVIARSKPGVTHEAVLAELTLLSRQASLGMTSKPPGSTVRVVSLHESMVGSVRAGWLVLMGAAALILLIACANVGGVLLARATARRPEIAIRLALGAGLRQLARQLLAESAVLTLLGALAGLCLAYAGLRLSRPYLSADLTGGQEIRLDAPVLWFTLLAAVTTGLAFGLLPIWECRRVAMHDVLKQGERRLAASARLRVAFVVVQVALGLALLVAAAGMIRTFSRLQQVDLGFDARQVLSFSVQLPSGAYPRLDPQLDFHRAVLRQLQTLPGVEHASLASAVPFAGAPPARAIMTAQGEGVWGPEEGERHRIEVNYVDASFFPALRIRFLEGGAFDSSAEAAGSVAVVINAALRDRFFPGLTAVGKHIKIGFAESSAPWLNIVGVVGDSHQSALNEDAGPMLFRPLRQASNLRLATYVLRVNGDPALLVEPSRRAVAHIDAGIPLSNVKTMDQRLSEWVAPQRLRAALLGAVAALAMAMTAMGLYGLLAYLTSQRRSEIGIRMALGATPAAILRTVLWRTAACVASGMVIGLAASIAAGRFLSGLLFGVAALDPLSVGGACVLLFVVATGAAFVPAWRASKTDPVTCLRQE